MQNKLKYLILFVFTLFIQITAAQDFPKPMQPARLVNDFANIFTEQQKYDLEQLVVNNALAESNQIAIVTVNDLHGYEVADYTTQLFDKWGVGDKKYDNGVIMLIKPKTKESNGQIFIATGYGLEGSLPDALCWQIINNEIIPHFKNNDYYSGAKQGLISIISATKGEYKPTKQTIKDTDIVTALIVLGVIFIIVIALFGPKKNSGGNNSGNCGNSAASILPFIFLNNLSNSGSRGGSFGGGGFSGGGFGGFGGGMSGGGGAGGSW